MKESKAGLFGTEEKWLIIGHKYICIRREIKKYRQTNEKKKKSLKNVEGGLQHIFGVC